MGRHRITFYSQDAQLKEIRAADPERYERWAFACERAAIRRLDRAFKAFFRRVQGRGEAGLPAVQGTRLVGFHRMGRKKTVPAGTPYRILRSPASTSRASGMFASTSTVPSRAG